MEQIVAPKIRLDWKYLAWSYFLMSVVIALAFFKIYIHQQIYYESRKIAKLKERRELLKEENKVIRSAVESIRFKNQIADTMFDE